MWVGYYSGIGVMGTLHTVVLLVVLWAVLALFINFLLFLALRGLSFGSSRTSSYDEYFEQSGDSSAVVMPSESSEQVSVIMDAGVGVPVEVFCRCGYRDGVPFLDILRSVDLRSGERLGRCPFGHRAVRRALQLQFDQVISGL